ncbi:MAG: CYTH domain-containing protein [Treponema sp.]|nr:CYTH domain-containing protein [Treponema sp.]
MYEIEMKAHVPDKTSVITKLNSFAQYLYSINKYDTYYHLKKSDKDYISFRIREETILKNNQPEKKILFTYKNKEIKINPDGTSIEVNSENECFLSDSEPIVKFMKACGASVALKKHKITECWIFKQDNLTANIELCNVPPLGDFLEIEIISEDNSSNFIDKAKKFEEKIFLLAGLSLDLVEERYYSEMLNGISKNCNF